MMLFELDFNTNKFRFYFVKILPNVNSVYDVKVAKKLGVEEVEQLTFL